MLRLDDRTTVVTNLYFPKNKPDHRSYKRLKALCECVGETATKNSDELSSLLQGKRLRVKIRTMPGHSGNGWQEYRDVSHFLPSLLKADPKADSTPAKQPPKAPQQKYTMFIYDE